MERIEVGTLVILPSVPYFPCKGDSETAWLDDKEWRLFDALWQCTGTMVTREYLFLCVYPDPRSRPTSIRAIDVLVCRVRKKLKFLFNGENCIRHIRKEGYKFCIPKYC